MNPSLFATKNVVAQKHQVEFLWNKLIFIMEPKPCSGMTKLHHELSQSRPFFTELISEK